LVGSTVGGGNIALKEEGFEKPPQQRVSGKVSGQGLALGGELLLRAADKNFAGLRLGGRSDGAGAT
jgi:hypothetical protein